MVQHGIYNLQHLRSPLSLSHFLPLSSLFVTGDDRVVPAPAPALPIRTSRIEPVTHNSQLTKGDRQHDFANNNRRAGQSVVECNEQRS